MRRTLAMLAGGIDVPCPMLRPRLIGTVIGVAFKRRALDIAFLLVAGLDFDSGEAPCGGLAARFVVAGSRWLFTGSLAAGFAASRQRFLRLSL
jgi:hypothetical protein